VKVGELTCSPPSKRGPETQAGHKRSLHSDLSGRYDRNGPQGVLEVCALISTIGVEFKQKGIKAEQGCHQQRAAIAILDIGGMHDGVHQEALRIDENVPLLPLDPRIDAGPPFSALFTLWLSMIAALGEASRSALSRHSM
jgi:hypothetical protein